MRPTGTIIQRPPDPEVRASAGRIVDILQRLVLVGPDMIIPLEEIMREMLTSGRQGVVAQMWERQDELRPRDRPPQPPVPLGQLPARLALLEPPATQRTTRRRTVRPADKQKRR